VKVIALALVGTAVTFPRLAPAHFRSGYGWHVGANRVHACPGVPRSRCEQVTSWAATVRFRDCGDCIPPNKTLAVLPRAGISIQLLLGSPPSKGPALAWPPRIRSREVVGPIEGGPPRIGSVQKFGRRRGFNVYLYVFFGRRHPTPAQLARASAEFASARLP
jgi:hypothetical protein